MSRGTHSSRARHNRPEAARVSPEVQEGFLFELGMLQLKLGEDRVDGRIEPNGEFTFWEVRPQPDEDRRP